VLMYGSLPAYRALKEGVSDGPDVAELNENLIALGYDPYGAIGTREDFGAATTAAVKRWQHAAGLSENGQVELGRVIFAAGERRVTSLHVTLGEDPPAASEEAAAKQKLQEEAAAAKRREEEAAAKRTQEAATDKRREEAAAKRKAEAEAHRHHKNPRSSNHSKENSNKHNEGSGNKKEDGGSKEKEGSGANKEKEGSSSPTAAQPKLALSTTGRQQIVQLQVKANQQQLAHVGERTNVTLPDGTTVPGHISGVGTVATESSENEHGGGGGGNGENATVAVTLALDRHVSHLDKAPVSVELVKSVRRDVLAVPATALVAVSGGGYAVQVLEGNRRALLPVTTGMFAGGYVEVEGAGLHEGLTVLVPQ
jgi:peptidoglycan hydrolase-like protein with peptidoglycan-binding domain